MSRLKLVLVTALLVACGGGGSADDLDGDSADSDDADRADDGDDPVIDAPACALGPSVDRATFEAESVTYLRGAFEASAGFTGGTITYREGSVALADGCSLADWTALIYVAPIDDALVPVELRGTTTHVAAVWSLNGRKLVAFVDAPSAAEPAPWVEGRLPDNVNAVALESATAAELDTLVGELRTSHPDLAIEWLDAIGILTVSGAVGEFFDEPIATTAAEVERAAATVRASGLFEPAEWSGLNFRIPHEFWAGVPLEGEQLRAECERTHTLPQLPVFTTSPGFAAPLGTGPVPRTPDCR